MRLNTHIPHLLIGQGYNEFSHQPTRQVVVKEGHESKDGHHKVGFRLAVLDSEDALSELLDVSTAISTESSAASAASIPSISSEFKSMSAFRDAEHVTYIALCAYDITGLVTLDPDYASCDWIKKLKDNDESLNRLYQLGGTAFARQNFSGRATWAVISIKSRDKKTAREVRAGLKANAAIVQGKAAVDHLAKKLSHLDVVNIVLDGVGVVLPNEYTSQYNWIDIINQLAKRISEESSNSEKDSKDEKTSLAKPGPLGFQLSNYSVISTDPTIAALTQRFTKYTLEMKAQSKKIASLLRHVQASLNFYFSFHESNENYLKNKDPRSEKIKDAKSQLQTLAQELQAQLDEYPRVVRLTDYSIEGIQARIKDWDARFADLQKILPATCQYTPIKTVAVSYGPWKKVGINGTSRRISDNFNLTLPPNTNQLFMVISKSSGHQQDPMTPINVKIDLKQENWRRIKLNRNIFREGQEGFILDFDPNSKALDFERLYFASSENESPSQACEYTVTIYAGNSRLLIDSPSAFVAENKSRSTTPDMPKHLLGRGQPDFEPDRRGTMDFSHSRFGDRATLSPYVPLAIRKQATSEILKRRESFVPSKTMPPAARLLLARSQSTPLIPKFNEPPTRTKAEFKPRGVLHREPGAHHAMNRYRFHAHIADAPPQSFPRQVPDKYQVLPEPLHTHGKK